MTHHRCQGTMGRVSGRKSGAKLALLILYMFHRNERPDMIRAKLLGPDQGSSERRRPRRPGLKSLIPILY